TGKFTIQKREKPIMMYLKTKPAWAQLFMFLGLAFGSFIILSMIGMLLLANITGLNVLEMGDPSNWDYNNPALLTFIRGMLLIQFLFLFIVPCFLFAYFADPKPAGYLGLRSANPAFYILGALVLIVAIPLVDWLGVFNHQLIPETTSLGRWMKASEEQAGQQIAFMLKKNSIRDLLMNILFIAVFAGVGEELFFRGILQRIFIRIFKNPWAGIIITAVIFSAIHLQFYGFIPRFILGVLLGLIYWYSGSLWPAIIAHFAYDAFAVILIYFNPSMIDQKATTLQLGNPVLMTLISAALVVLLVYQMKKKSVANYHTVYAADKIDDQNPF
ncbi:MAG TPA: type II CAAX endopeptidase family protein, partial [Chitinophagaceae bacterium]|nr:type II CAAX endopeptidase family protein [Chitinophagaceae bacterium]